MIQQVGVQAKFDAVCVCVFGYGCGYIKVPVCWQLPWGVAKRSLCTILRTGSKTSECRDFKWPELWQQETCGYLDWFLHHYVWHMWRSLLISVQICIQSFGAVYPVYLPPIQETKWYWKQDAELSKNIYKRRPNKWNRDSRVRDIISYIPRAHFPQQGWGKGMRIKRFWWKHRYHSELEESLEILDNRNTAQWR